MLVRGRTGRRHDRRCSSCQRRTRLSSLSLTASATSPTRPTPHLTPLEAAAKPNIDRLAAEKGVLGRTIPVGVGITPGSGPGHLSLFGYDPVRYEIGRGILEVLGLNMDIGPGDIAAQGEFLHGEGRHGHGPEGGQDRDLRGRRAALRRIQRGDPVGRRREGDHKAGRIPQVRDHISGARACPTRSRTRTPQGQQALCAAAPKTPRRSSGPGGQRVHQEGDGVLKGEPQANGVLLRGFSRRPDIPPFPDEVPDGFPRDHHLPHVPGHREGPRHEGGEGAARTMRRWSPS